MKQKCMLLVVFASAVGTAFTDAIQPSESAAATCAAIQGAIDTAAASAEPGTVTLGAGVFEIDAQLMVTGGVSLVGQGFEKTVVRQTAVGQRCVTLSGGSILEGVTLTGGHTRAKFESGAGVLVEDGTVSWCCITNNQAGDATWSYVTVNNIYGAGVNIKKGAIDHTVVAFNTAYMNGGGSSHGGGIGVNQPNGPILVDTCLVYGNRAPSGNGGAIYAEFGNNHHLMTIRGTTIAQNEASGQGGGVYESQNVGKGNFDIAFVNCIMAENVSGNGDANLAFHSYGDATAIRAGCAAQSCGNIFDNGTEFGENSMSVAESGDAWFADAENGDFHLATGSPAIGVGTAYDGISEDLDRVERGASPAAGCYEFLSAVVERKGVIFSIR